MEYWILTVQALPMNITMEVEIVTKRQEVLYGESM
jgi:hypothetical protein